MRGFVVENIHSIENSNQPDYSMKRTQRFKRVSKPKKPIPDCDLDEDSAANLSTQLLKTTSTRIKTKMPKILSLPTPTSLTFDQMTILPPEFFQIDALDLAPRLLGKFLKRDNVVLQITEAEAYRPNDSACHGRFGITARTAPVFGPGGHAYVYLCYGLHTMLNVVADKEGNGAAVLIRSCAPISGNL
ncbi:hypothetical protein SADUNF_Sadunf16G0054100 [Salix dunnii]|uniref:DNA-3-methyladenine glycosylase II n=1 Tax=Salix dunnii TaxID=1413687 RepID=A0A835J782_9ROSI|nr:hypothetical protein SADUNF_Sadunf16G0054100 [Salix dunnii]